MSFFKINCAEIIRVVYLSLPTAKELHIRMRRYLYVWIKGYVLSTILFLQLSLTWGSLAIPNLKGFQNCRNQSTLDVVIEAYSPIVSPICNLSALIEPCSYIQYCYHRNRNTLEWSRSNIRVPVRTPYWTWLKGYAYLLLYRNKHCFQSAC